MEQYRDATKLELLMGCFVSSKLHITIASASNRKTIFIMQGVTQGCVKGPFMFVRFNLLQGVLSTLHQSRQQKYKAQRK